MRPYSDKIKAAVVYEVRHNKKTHGQAAVEAGVSKKAVGKWVRADVERERAATLNGVSKETIAEWATADADQEKATPLDEVSRQKLDERVRLLEQQLASLHRSQVDGQLHRSQADGELLRLVGGVLIKAGEILAQRHPPHT